MEYTLHSGKKVNIRKPCAEDAEAVVHVLTVADTETLFLARNPGEFTTTVEREKSVIEGILNDKDVAWFVAEIDNYVVGQCSIGLVRRSARYRHRAEVAFVILKDYCDQGIGGKMMLECLNWCKEKGVTQLELDVVKGNERALKMYESFGFKITGTITKALHYQDGTYADEYFMFKDI